MAEERTTLHNEKYLTELHNNANLLPLIRLYVDNN